MHTEPYWQSVYTQLYTKYNTHQLINIKLIFNFKSLQNETCFLNNTNIGEAAVIVVHDFSWKQLQLFIYPTNTNMLWVIDSAVDKPGL